MSAPTYLDLGENRRLAYHKTDARGEMQTRAGVVFLGGFKSDMEGTKALALEEWAAQTGRQFLRFDYRGHGQSSAAFEDGCIGDWASDAMEAVGRLTTGPQLLIGSSMGGWIACLVARAMPDRVAGLIGIAAAPDFTEDSIWVGMTEAEREEMAQTGRLARPSEYSDEPYVFTRKLIEDGRENLVLRTPLTIRGPVRLLQGTADEDVDQSVALRLLAHIESPDTRLTLVKGADHRFSEDREIALLIETAEELC